MRTVEVEHLEWSVDKVTQTTADFLGHLLDTAGAEGIDLLPDITHFLPPVIESYQKQLLTEHQLSNSGILMDFSSHPPIDDRSLTFPLWKPHFLLDERFDEDTPHSEIDRVRRITMEFVSAIKGDRVHLSNRGLLLVIDFPTEIYAQTIGTVKLPLLGE